MRLTRERHYNDAHETSAALRLKDLHVGFQNDGRVTKAVKGVSFDIFAGETLDWSAKAARANPSARCPFCGFCPIRRLSQGRRALFSTTKTFWRWMKKNCCKSHSRCNDISMIFQEPMSSLNPLHNIEKQIAEVVELHQGVRRESGARRGAQIVEAGRYSQCRTTPHRPAA